MSFLANLFKSKPGGTFVGNALRNFLKNAILDLLANPAEIKKPGQLIKDVVKGSRTAADTETVEACKTNLNP